MRAQMWTWAMLCAVAISNGAWAQSLTGLRIDGPAGVTENSLEYYNVIAEFDNDLEFDVTLSSYLWVEPGDVADIDMFGGLTTFEAEADTVETIHAYYAFGADDAEATLDVTVDNIFNVLAVEPADGTLLQDPPTEIVIALSEPADPATINTNTVRLIRSDDDVFGNEDDETIVPNDVYLLGDDQVVVDLTAVDLSDGNYRATLAASGPGHALRFSAVDATVARVLRDGTLEPSELTVEAWILATGEGDPGSAIVHKFEPYAPGYVLRWNLEYRPNIIAEVLYQNMFNSAQAADPTPHARLIGEWHHVAFTYSTSSNALALFIDGIEITRVDGPGGITHSGDLGIGNIAAKPDVYLDGFDGLIDEVRIWNVAHTEVEIQELMHRSLNGSEPGLAGYWRFDEGSGQIVFDSSVNANDGTLGLNSDSAGDSYDPEWVVSTAPIYGVTNVDGVVLDGEFDGSFPSGDGVPGGDFVSTFTLDKIFRVEAATPEPNAVLQVAPPEIVIALSEPADPNSVNAGNVRILRGVDGEFDNGNDEVVVSTSVQLSDDRTIVVDLLGVTMPNDTYRLEINAEDADTALAFDGGQYVTVPNSPSLSITSSLTLETWARLNNPGGSWQQIIFKGDTRSGQDPYYLRVEGGYLQFGIDHAYNEGTKQSFNVMGYDWSVFHHLAAVFDDPNDEMRLYIDGELVDTEPTTWSPMPDQTGTDIQFGKEAKYLQLLDGELDEIRIWAIARSQDDIRLDMSHRLTGQESGLVGYWRLDEGQGQVAHDLSQFGNDGILGGDVTVQSYDPQWVISDAPLYGVTNVDGVVLDGEFGGTFPSGDGVPGGDFVYEFTVDAGPYPLLLHQVKPAGRFFVTPYAWWPDNVTDAIRTFQRDGMPSTVYLEDQVHRFGGGTPAFDVKGRLVYGDSEYSHVYVINGTGNIVEDINGGGLSGPHGIAVAPDGTLVTGSYFTDSVKFYDPNGIYIADLRHAGTEDPVALAYDSHGNLFVASRNNGRGRVAVFNSSLEFVRYIGEGILVPNPTSLAFDRAGSLWVTKPGAVEIFGWDGMHAATITHPDLDPFAIAFDEQGNAYVTNTMHHDVFVFGPKGNLLDRVDLGLDGIVPANYLLGGIAFEKIGPTLISTDPHADGTLSKVANNVIRLTFDGTIWMLGEPRLDISPLDGGADVGGAFTYTLDGDGITLAAAENGQALTNLVWYRITPMAVLNVAPFTLDLCTLIGDASGDGRVMAADLGVIWSHNGETTDARYDINGDGRVMAVDLSVTWAHNGQSIPPKP